MSAVTSGIVRGISDAASRAADRKYQQEQQQKQNEWNLYSKVAFDNRSVAEGGPTDEERQYAMDQVAKRGGKDVKSGLQKFSSFRTLMESLGGKQNVPAPTAQAPRAPLAAPAGVSQAQPAAQPSTAPQVAQDRTGATGMPRAYRAGDVSGQTMKPEGISDSQWAQFSPAERNAWVMSESERKRREKLAKDWGLKGAEGAEFVESGKLAPGSAKQNALAQLTEAYKAAGMDEEEASKEAGKVVAKQAETKAAPKESSKKEIWMNYPGDPQGSIGHAVWIDPKDPSKKIDANTNKPVPEGATQINTSALQARIRAQGYSQAAKYAAALRMQGVPEEEANRRGGEMAQEEAERRIALIGAERIHEAMGVGPSGESIAIPLRAAPVPRPIGGTPAAVPPPTPPGVTPARAQVATPGAPSPQPRQPGQPLSPPAGVTARPPAGAATTTPPAGPLGTRALGGVSPIAARQAAQISIPLTEATTQIFGDPRQPDIKAVASFADLADDPKAKERLGKAIQLTVDGFGEGIAGASIGAGAGPIHVSAGGFGEWLQNEMGIPGALAEQKAAMLRKAIDSLTPRERDAYDATMAEMSTMAGLRTLSRASPALGSIRMIEREMPKIGVNSNSSKQFYDQLQKVAGAVANAVNTPGLLPKVQQGGREVPIGITPEMYDRLTGLASEIEKKKSATPMRGLGKPGEKPKAPKPGDIQDGYRFKGGDPAKQENWEKVRAAA